MGRETHVQGKSWENSILLKEKFQLNSKKQQEMSFMWNSNAAWDGGVFYRTLGRWTDRSVPKTKEGHLWNHYHPGRFGFAQYIVPDFRASET